MPRRRAPASAMQLLLSPVLLFVAALLQGRWCLRLRSLHVPNSILVGEVAKLACVFDAEHDDLYSVKWYKDDVEFFRFLPNDRPANQFFAIGDVDVDMSRSWNGTVFLHNTNRSAEGTYRCEVSADAPSFQSISAEKFMAVEDRPPEIPSPAQRLGAAAVWLLLAVALLTALHHRLYIDALH